MKDIKSLSIRARVAYCILCLENALESTSQNETDWQFILKQFWLFTNIEYVDEWLYIVSKIMPNVILNDGFQIESNLTYEQYQLLKKVYKGTPEFIFDIIECIFLCGRRHLYSAVPLQSPETYVLIKSLRKLMRKHLIQLPNEGLFKKYHIRACQGWGVAFERKDLFLI
jgi:hypothetical protein